MLTKEMLPHSHIGGFQEEHIPLLKDVIELVKPTLIFEIGFNSGKSALLWLQLSPGSVVSVDPGDHPAVHLGGDLLKSYYPTRFAIFHVSSQIPWLESFLKEIGRKFDLSFIDGDHTYSGCLSDLVLCAKLDIPYLLVDNCEDLEHVNRAVTDFLIINPNYKLHKEYEVKAKRESENIFDTYIIKLLKKD